MQKQMTQDKRYPIYKMSKASVKAFNESKKAEKAGKLIKVTDISNFLKTLPPANF